jgi:hypothetical protein
MTIVEAREVGGVGYDAFASLVVETLRDTAPCGYRDPSLCPSCPTRSLCAERAERHLKQKYPFAIWKPQINKALSGHLSPN